MSVLSVVFNLKMKHASVFDLWPWV